MIIGEGKPIEDILAMIADRKKIIVLGCRGCVTVCSAGGQKEVEILSSTIRLGRTKEGKPIEIREDTIERQCDTEYLDELRSYIDQYEAVLSLACGAGVQAMAKRFADIPMLPGVNTTFIGIQETEGIFTEECSGCGDCELATFGGICPVTRCAKKLMNGPCGGSQDGKCEINPETDCAWNQIIDRLTKLDQMDNLKKIIPPKNWNTSLSGGPRKLVREDHII
jgi:ferredoxin